VDNLRTVSDTKRDFYARHTRPINSVYGRVVEELLVEMHLLSVNVDFRSDPIYYLGVVTSFDRFMEGYEPEKDKDSIFAALCQSVGGNAREYRNEAAKLTTFAQERSGEELIAWLASPTPIQGMKSLSKSLQEITNNPKFKYSRLFAIGLYSLLEQADSELVKEEESRDRSFKQIAEALHLPLEKLNKDLELYRGNLEKMTQMLTVLQDTLEADRKKQQERSLAKEPETKTNSPDLEKKEEG